MSTKRRSQPSPNRATIITAVAVVAVLGLALALALGGGSGGDDGADPAASAFGTPSVVGAPLPPLGDPAADLALGADAPVLTATAVDGTDVTVGAGAPQLVAFLAHWCSHCRAEVPVVVDWVAAGGLPDDVQLVAVATATDATQPNFPPQPWLEREAWPAPVVLDDEVGTAAAAYGVRGFPFWVVLDAGGTVVARASGELTPAQLDALVAAAG